MRNRVRGVLIRGSEVNAARMRRQRMLTNDLFYVHQLQRVKRGGREFLYSNLQAVEEELAGEGDPAVQEVGLDEGAADVAFAGLIGVHAAIGEDGVGAEFGGLVVA